jgi:hypothetical protein
MNNGGPGPSWGWWESGLHPDLPLRLRRIACGGMMSDGWYEGTGQDNGPPQAPTAPEQEYQK